MSRGLVLLIAGALQQASAYWDGSRDTLDPYMQAMKMSKQARHDPDLMKQDRDAEFRTAEDKKVA